MAGVDTALLMPVYDQFLFEISPNVDSMNQYASSGEPSCKRFHTLLCAIL